MLPDDDPRHGHTSGHNAGCRCDPCCVAKLAYDKRRRLDLMQGRNRTIPAWRLTRRIEALQARGWSLRTIAAEAGVTHNHLATYGHDRQRVYASAFYKIADTYERLAMKEPPQETRGQKSGVARTRNFARRNGLIPPLGWVDIDDPDERPHMSVTDNEPDPVVVERILAGDWRLKATPAERRLVVEQWNGSLNELARLTGWKVERYHRIGEVA